MSEVWLAEKNSGYRPNVVGIFSRADKARAACQDDANQYFGEAKTPALRWLGDDGHSSASHHDPAGMSFFQVTRYTVDEVDGR